MQKLITYIFPRLLSLAVAMGFVAFLGAQAITGEYHIRKVVIDAGHGGKDSGVTGKTAKEKDIVLAVALKTGHFIKEKHPDVEVIFTRDKDVFLEVHERSGIANTCHADLFISIHANSVLNRKNTTVGGFETFVMGLDKSDKNMEVAKRENAVITYEKDYATKYEGYDPNSPESFIIFSLMQNVYFDQSLLFASLIQDEMERSSPIEKNRGVLQGPLLVLWHTAMPGVLTEIGFLSNPAEEAMLQKQSSQDSIAKSIAAAFTHYKQHHERRHKPTETTPPATTTNKTAASTATAKPTAASNRVSAAASTPSKTVSYAVQIFAVSTKKANNAPEFTNLRDIRCFPEGRLFLYTVGDYAAYEEAQLLCHIVRGKYPGAFVVRIQNGKITRVVK